MSYDKKLPWLGCNYNGRCGDKKYGCGCGTPSANRYNEAGPAVITKEWDIGNRKCAGGLKKCTGVCGNKYCSMNGKCAENNSEILECFDDSYYVPSAIGVGAGSM